MKWIIDNWSLLVVIACAGIAGIVYVKKFMSLPTTEQIKKVKEWLLWAVVQAEAELGSGTGTLKLRYVYDMFLERFPEVAKLISFEQFSKLVDEVLEYMRRLIDSNLDIACFVQSGGNV